MFRREAGGRSARRPGRVVRFEQGVGRQVSRLCTSTFLALVNALGRKTMEGEELKYCEPHRVTNVKAHYPTSSY